MEDHDPMTIAQDLIQRHGLRAQAMAEVRAAELRQHGDMEGFERWCRIQAAIAGLKSTRAKPDEELH
jgi:hypothetical protein